MQHPSESVKRTMHDVMSSYDSQKSANLYALEIGALEKKRLLLHCCCAPCASYVISQLVVQYELTLFFYNPNIEPLDEYIKRKRELEKLSVMYTLHYKTEIKMLSCEYDNERFANAANLFANEREGGARCRLCFDIRLEETARVAKALSFDAFATTLSVSPYKDAAILNESGIKHSAEHDILYIEADFKKNDGYKRSIELSKKYGLYRQRYCGCTYSNNTLSTDKFNN